MNWPADGTMLALLAHEAGDTFTVVGGELRLTVKADGADDGVASGDSTACPVIPAPVAVLDELEDRAWIVVLPRDGTAITQSGRYWLSKWLVTRLGKGRLVRRVNNLKVTREVA